MHRYLDLILGVGGGDRSFERFEAGNNRSTFHFLLTTVVVVNGINERNKPDCEKAVRDVE